MSSWTSYAPSTLKLATAPPDGGSYKIWLEYADGAAGEVDLSHLVGSGIFKAWEDVELFRQVHITDYRSIAWNDQIDLCPDALYMDLTGCTWEEMYPPPAAVRADV